MAGLQVSGYTLSKPLWADDFFTRDHLLPFPIKLDPAQFNKPDAVVVTVGAAGAQGGVDEVQTLAITGTPGGGTFTITFNGQTTAAIAYNADAAAVQAALEALSNINVGDVKVYGANPNFTLVFGGSLGKQNVAQITTTNSFTGGSSPNTTITTTVAGVAGATSVPVSALSGAIPNGTVLDFSGTGKRAVLTVAAAAGDTALTVEALPESLGAGDTATYAGASSGKLSVPSGTLVGRTYTERDAKTAFGPAVSTDDEIYLIVFDMSDLNINNDAVPYRHGSVVKENFLPGWSGLGGTMQAKIRALYQTVVGNP